MKDGNTTFRTIMSETTLKEHFKAHFNICSEVIDPIELKDAPNFIRQLQDINNTELNTTLPGKEELRSTVKSLKNGKSANDVPSA